MRPLRAPLAALLAVLAVLVAGCGGTHTVTRTVTVTAPTITVALPESAVTPSGPGNPTPPMPARPPHTFGSSAHEQHIDGAGLRLIEQFEGYSRCAYQDVTGVWTAGFGQTHGVGPRFCFSSRAAAEVNLKESVESEYAWAVRDLGYPFTQNAFDGLCSFAYNLGAGIFVGTLRTDLEHGQIYSATRIMLEYDHAGGVVLPGLATRRADEVRLILTPKPKPKPKPTRAQLLNRRAALRRDLTDHRCRVAPYHGRGRYHAVCAHWLREGAQVNREMEATR